MAATNEAEKKERTEGEDDQEKRGDSERHRGAQARHPLRSCTERTDTSPPRSRTTTAREPASAIPTLTFCSRPWGTMFEHDRSAGTLAR